MKLRSHAVREGRRNLQGNVKEGRRKRNNSGETEGADNELEKFLRAYVYAESPLDL